VRSILLRVSLIVLAMSGPAGTTLAGCPDPNKSSMSPCLVVCPAGDTEFRVNARFFSNNPYAGPVVLDFSACPGFHLSPANGTEAYIVDPRGPYVWMNSDLQGNAIFHIRGGGGSGGIVSVTTCNSTYPDSVSAYGVPLGTRTLVSPDRNGDLVVGPDDIALVVAAVGTTDASADFDCDGAVTAADVAVAQSHLGHTGDRATAARTSSWGALKLLYR